MAKKKRTKSTPSAERSKSPRQKPPRKKPARQQTDAKETTAAKRSKSSAQSKANSKTPTDTTQPIVTTAQPTAIHADNDVVVGLGASAGGLEAFKRFLEKMPHDSGMAFVLIQHLDPDHESMMAELLSKYTSMTVVQAGDATPIEPNHVYIIPPNKFIKLQDGKLHLDSPIKQRGLRMPIDYFFRSLAEHHRERAVGIVLSGTASDGSLGLREIKARGGMVMVQQPDTAAYDGMPQNAISTGIVDVVCPIEKMPDVLLKYIQHSYINRSDAGARTLIESAPGDFESIIALLRAHTDYDFQCYKKGTLSRRIQRRMGLRHVEKTADYLKLLRNDPDELGFLFKDLLISVTAFFREQDAWPTLATEVIAKLVQRKKFDQPVRVWVPGCATGEEVYSIAMLLHEQFEAQNRPPNLQIFGTDLDEDAISIARQGTYPNTIAADVSPTRLNKFFQEDGQHYRVQKSLREASVFAVQNLIGDPPFSNLDLVSCRNLMIYLESEIQHEVIKMFHFALREGGYLFLGTSESVGKHASQFRTVSKQWRIYNKIGSSQQGVANFPIMAKTSHEPEMSDTESASRDHSFDPVDFARNVLLDRFAPASALINREYRVQYFHGPVRKYLDIPSGEPTTDLTALCLKGLRSKLRGGIHQCLQEGQPIQVIAPHVQRDDKWVTIQIDIEALPHRHGEEPLLLVTFKDETREHVEDSRLTDAQPLAEQTDTSRNSKKSNRNDRRDKSDDTNNAFADQRHLVSQLEYELQATREDLQSSIAELESANEELKASNEEVMSMNEELQSANEELETSREELQSLNEELSTVNNQLEDKVGELETTNNDLTNLLSSTEIATIFLDPKFCIRRFTPATMDLLNVIDSDIGRPISDLSPRFNDPYLYRDARKVLQYLAPLEREVHVHPHVTARPYPESVAEPSQTNAAEHDQEARDLSEQRWFMRRILPYRTSENSIEGVVITFTEITSLKRSAFQLAKRERQAAVVAQLGRAALGGESIKSLFRQTVTQVAETLGCDFCKVLKLTKSGNELLLLEGVGWEEGAVGNTRLPAGINSQAGYTLQSSSPVIVDDLRAEKRFSGPPLLINHRVVSGISLVIGPANRPWGVLGAHSTSRLNITIDDANFMQAVANTLWDVIDRERTDATLRSQLAELKSIYDTAPAGLGFIDVNLRYVRINERLAAINGPSVEEHLGRTIRDVLPDLADTLEPIYRRIIDSGEPELDVQIHGMTPADSRKEHDWLVSYFPLTVDGQVTGVNSVVVDITERQRYAEELLAARNRVTDILQSINDGFVGFDREWRYMYVNRTATELLEKSEDELLGEVVWDAFPDLLDTPFSKALQETFDEQRNTEVEAFFAPHNRWYRCRIYPSANGVSVYFSDVTEVRLARKRVEESEERLRLAAEAARVGTFDADLETGMVYWSPQTKSILGLPEDAVVHAKAGDVEGDFVYPEDREMLAEAYAAAVDPDGSGVFEIEHRVILPNAEVRWVHAQGQTIFSDDMNGRQAIRMTGTVVDITARKRVTLELNQLNENLEQRVQERASLIQLLHDVTAACHHARTIDDAISFVLQAFAKHGNWCYGQAFGPSDDDRTALVAFSDFYANESSESSPLNELHTALARLRLNQDRGLAGRVYMQGTAEFTNDQSLAEIMGVNGSQNHRDVFSLSFGTAAAFPIKVGTEVVAVLLFLSDCFNADEHEQIVETMTSIGAQLGRVVERIRLQREVAELASKEQQRIGSELHDTVIQQLTGSEMMAESLRQKIAAETVVKERDAAHLVDTLKDAQRQVRRLHRGLMPVEVDAAGLMSALENLASQTSSLHNVRCMFECDEDVLISDSTTATYLFRIAQEAVHNAIKHAQPSLVTISLNNGNQVRLAVKDDGQGVDGDVKDFAGNGIRIMHYRAEVIGGRLLFDTKKNFGTTVTCIVCERV